MASERKINVPVLSARRAAAVEAKGSEGALTPRRRIVPKITISDNPSEVFVVRFSPDGKLLAAGCADGAIRVLELVNNIEHLFLILQLGVQHSDR